MLKRIKLSVCFVMTLALLFSFTCGSVFADTKTVSVTTSEYFTCTGPEIGTHITNIQSSTYNYNDGSYSGVLSYSQINSVSVVPINYNYTIFQVTVSVTYSGTVTSIPIPPTKTVYATDTRTFTCEGSQVSTNMQAIQNSTYYYNDGTYHGTLNYSSISNVNVTVVGHNSSGDILYFVVTVNYAGTVTT